MLKPIKYHCANRIVLGAALLLEAQSSLAQNFQRYQRSGRFRSDDYLLKSFNDHTDPLFDGSPQTIDLGLNVDVGSDCGRVNFEGTMRSTLENLLDPKSKYFGDLGRTIVGASPLLLTCYMSPTWCAILKHSQVNANFLSQMRLDQCALVDKYVDSRTEDYYRERQDCVRQKIAENGGDLERAMGSCQNVYNADLKNWAGRSSGDKATTNKLIESSAKWVGLSGPEAERTTDLLKALVGDTVVGQGSISVEYGSRRKALTPEIHLKDLQARTHEKLCEDIVLRVSRDFGRRSVDQSINDSDLKDISAGANEILVDRQTLEALALMPPRQRQIACKRLSDTVAMTVFTKDVNRSVDVLAIATQNPNLPPERKAELEEKRRRLKESVDLTLELERQRNDPLRSVLKEVNEQGEHYRSRYTAEVLHEDSSAVRTQQARRLFYDCADGVMCGEGR